MVQTIRGTLVFPVLAGIALVSTGFVLLVSWAYPDVQCYGDACLIGQNSLAIPAILIGAVLEFVALVAHWSSRTNARAAKN